MKYFFLAFLISISAWGKDSVRPVSLSYDNIILCFGELSDEGNSYKVDLNRLKELMDRRFTTLNSSVRYRVVVFKDGDVQKRMKYQRQGDTKNYTLTLEKMDDKGVWSDVPLEDAQRVNPKLGVMGSILGPSRVLSDDAMYDDSKYKDLVMSYRRSFAVVSDLQLSDKLHKKSLSCENQKDLGIICTCSKK